MACTLARSSGCNAAKNRWSGSGTTDGSNPRSSETASPHRTRFVASSHSQTPIRPARNANSSRDSRDFTSRTSSSSRRPIRKPSPPLIITSARALSRNAVPPLPFIAPHPPRGEAVRSHSLPLTVIANDSGATALPSGSPPNHWPPRRRISIAMPAAESGRPASRTSVGTSRMIVARSGNPVRGGIVCRRSNPTPPSTSVTGPVTRGRPVDRRCRFESGTCSSWKPSIGSFPASGQIMVMRPRSTNCIDRTPRAAASVPCAYSGNSSRSSAPLSRDAAKEMNPANRPNRRSTAPRKASACVDAIRRTRARASASRSPACQRSAANAMASAIPPKRSAAGQARLGTRRQRSRRRSPPAGRRCTGRLMTETVAGGGDRKESPAQRSSYRVPQYSVK